MRVKSTKSKLKRRKDRLAETTAYFKRKTVKAKSKTKEKLIKELSQRIAELKTLETSGSGWRGYEN